jgi:PPP family 3-phenylpropionic acid transporter
MTGLVRLAFAAFFFSYFAYIGLMSPYSSLYFASKGMGPIEIAALMSMFQITRIMGPFAWGWLADMRRDRLGIIRMTSLAACFIFSAIFFLEDYIALLVWMFLLNIVISSLMPLGEAATVHALHQNNGFDKRYGRLRLWGSLGFITMVMSAGAWFEAFGIQSLPWFGLGALIVMTGLTLLLREPKMEVAEQVVIKFSLVLKDKYLQWFLSANFWMIFAHACFYVFYSLYLDQLGYSKSEIGLLWMLGVLAEVIFFFYQSHFFSRFSTQQILMTTYLIAVLRFALMAYYPNVIVLVIAQLMHAATFGAHHSASIKMLQTWFSGPLQGRGQALYTTVSYGIGGTVGGLCAGWIWEHWAPEHVFGLAALASFFGYVCMQRVKSKSN